LVPVPGSVRFARSGVSKFCPFRGQQVLPVPGSASFARSGLCKFARPGLCKFARPGPALHYHFASKADLGEALINRYATRFTEALAGLDAAADTGAKLAGYAGLYASVLHQQRMCLCGMLAAEYQTLPGPVRDSVLAFFDQNELWLEQVLAKGRQEGCREIPITRDKVILYQPFTGGRAKRNIPGGGRLCPPRSGRAIQRGMKWDYPDLGPE
jgi:hypothetical protein